MTDKEKWQEMVAASKEATEDFNGFADDDAIIWAADTISRLRAQLNDQLNDCINFNGGELTEIIMAESSRLLKEIL